MKFLIESSDCLESFREGLFKESHSIHLKISPMNFMVNAKQPNPHSSVDDGFEIGMNSPRRDEDIIEEGAFFDQGRPNRQTYSDLKEDFHQDSESEDGLTDDECKWALLSHLSPLASFVIPIIPFANILAPLIIWQIKKDDSDFVSQSALEALNFQISLTIYSFATFIVFLPALLIFPPFYVLFVALISLFLLAFGIIQVIIGGLKANEGIAYRYPMAIRLIK